MEIRRIFEGDRRARAEQLALLQQAGIGLDRHLDYSLGLYDEEGALRATGSFYRNTLRCLAVDSAWRGEGLLARVVSALIQELFARGERALFVYSKRDAADSIAPLGFHTVAATDDIVFMENRRQGFADYLAGLRTESGLEGDEVPAGEIGAIVLNANPFTLGHLYLVERAAAACRRLHLFIVSEEVSAFPYAVRERLIREGTAHLPGLHYHATGPYLVSSATFPSYFVKESEALTLAQAGIDAAVFVRIAQTLHISQRFVGEEPYSPATALYNRAMREILPKHGVALHIIPRAESADGLPISATRVRQLMMVGDDEALRPLLPESSYEYVTSPEGRAIVPRLKGMEKEG